MKFTLIKSTLLASLVVCSAAWAAPLEIAGSTTVQKTIIDPVTAKAKEKGLDLKMLGVGTSKGMLMLIEGKVPVAAISDTLDDAIGAAKKAGAASVPANLKMTTILTDKLIPIVHPDNKVSTLNKDQLKAIFSGKTTNWKDVGGVDAPIVVVVGPVGAATRAVIEKQVMGGTTFAASAKELRTTAAEIGEISRDKNAVGYVGVGVAKSGSGKVREVKAPEVSRPLGFVTIGEPNAEVKKLLDFLQTAETKKLFAE